MILGNLLKKAVIDTCEKMKQFHDLCFGLSLKKVRDFYNTNMLPPLRTVCQHFDPNFSSIMPLNSDSIGEIHTNSILPDYDRFALGLELISACKNRQADVAIQLINDGAYVNMTNPSGYTPLIYACSNSLSDVAIELINHGADVQKKYSDEKTTALIVACKLKLKDVCKLLIDSGANVNAADVDGYTPLLIASMHDSDFVDILKLLVKHGADVNATASNKSYPLWYACVNNNLDVCKFLLDNGSKFDDVCTINDYLHFWRSWNIIQLLVNHDASINLPDSAFADTCFGLNPLWYSCFHRNWDIAELLVDYGADVNIHCFGISPLALACTWGNRNIINLLLEHNADMHNTGLKSNALHWACTDSDNIDIVRMFLDHGIDINLRTIFDITPLHLSCSFNIDNISCLLIDHGANVNAKTLFDITPLSLACRSLMMKKTVAKLINNGADINAKSFLGTPLSIACENGFNFAVENLLTLGANIKIDDFDKGSIIEKAISGNLHYSSIVSLIKNGACVDSLLDNESFTLFEKDISSGSIKNSIATRAIMQHFKFNTSRLALSVDVANKSAYKFVLASKTFSDLWYTLDKAKKRIHSDDFVTPEFKFLLDSYQDFAASQLVRLISISKLKKHTQNKNHKLNRNKDVNLANINKLQYHFMIR